MRGGADGMTVITTPFTHDQPMSGTQAARGAIGRDRFLQDKVCAYLECSFYAGYAVGDRKDDRPCVGFTAPEFPDYLTTGFNVIAIDEHCVELALGDDLPGGVRRCDRLKVNVDGVQYTAKDPQHFLITGEQKRFQHRGQMYLCCKPPTNNERNCTPARGITVLGSC